MAATPAPPPPPPLPPDFSGTPSPVPPSSTGPLAPPEVPGGSFLSPAESVTSGGAKGSTPAPESDVKLWERAWSLDELRNGSQQWTLASDAGLLLYLQEFAQRLTSRTHDIEKQVDGLAQETEASQTRVQNTFNEFLMLANTQFVESRVYDEEERREDEATSERAKKDAPEKTREQIEAEVVPRITEALQFGLGVLENAFDTIEVPEDERSSDEEGEEKERTIPEPILEQKDPYALRPLPFLIGSTKFLVDDDVGIGEPESEEEEEEDEEGSIGADMSRSESSSEEESGSEVEEKKKKKERKRKDSDGSGGLFDVDSDSVSTSDDEDETDESASEKDEDEDDSDGREAKPKAGGGIDFASELASRIGAAIPTAKAASDEEAWGDGEDDKPATKEDKHKKKKKKRSEKKEKKGKSEESGGLFDGSQGDEFEGSAFEKSGGLFSKGGTLFDGSDEDEGDLFSDKPKKAPEPAKEAEPSPSTRKKPPAGAVAIFQGSLFGNEEEEQEVEEAPVVKKAPAGGGGGLFDASDEDEDEDDIFSTAPKVKQSKQAVVERKPAAPFDVDGDGDEEDDLFATKGPSKPADSKPAGTDKKKAPVGGISLFGGMTSPDEEDDLFSTMPSQTAPSSKSKTTTTAPAFSGGLFDDDEGEDDIFADKPKATTTTAPVKETPPQQSQSAKKKPVGGVSLFGGADLFGKSLKSDDDEPPKQETIQPQARVGIEEHKEDDSLFSTKPKAAQPATQPAAPSVGGGGDLFGSDNEDLFSVKSAPPLKESPKEVKKKPVGGVSLFGGKDLFAGKDGATKHKVDGTKKTDGGPLGSNEDKDDLFTANPKIEVKKQTDGGPLASAEGNDDLFSAPIRSKVEERKATKRGPLAGDEDEDDLFSTPARPKPTVEVKPVEAGPLGLDDDEEDLFSIPSKSKTQASPSQPVVERPDVVAASKPVARPAEVREVSKPAAPIVKTGGGGLFGDDDDDDDLFAPKKPTLQPADKMDGSPQPQRKKPVGGVSLFGGADLFGKSKMPAQIEPERQEKVERPVEDRKQPEPKVKPKAGMGLFGEDDDDDDLFAPPKPAAKAPPPSEPTPKKPIGGVSLFGGANLFAEPEQEKEPPKPKEAPKKPRGLFDNSKVDDDLFATETPSVVKPSTLGRRGLAINPAAMLPGAKPPMKPVDEKAVSFDAPLEVNTLNALTKNRSRGQARRPPSRRARQANASHTETDSATIPQSPLASSVSSPPRFPTSADDDLFGIKTAATPSAANKRLLDDSIFNSPVQPKPTAVDVDDDIFASKPPSRQQSNDTVPVVKTDKGDSAVAAVAEAVPEEDLFAELEKKPSKKPPKFTGPSDTELFGDTGDIFADAPSKPKATKKTTKKKKKVVQKEAPPAAATDQPEGSVFDDQDQVVTKPKKKVAKKSGGTKKSTKQQTANIFDEDAPSIFDDPSAGAS